MIRRCGSYGIGAEGIYGFPEREAGCGHRAGHIQYAAGGAIAGRGGDGTGLRQAQEGRFQRPDRIAGAPGAGNGAGPGLSGALTGGGCDFSHAGAEARPAPAREGGGGRSQAHLRDGGVFDAVPLPHYCGDRLRRQDHHHHHYCRDAEGGGVPHLCGRQYRQPPAMYGG